MTDIFDAASDHEQKARDMAILQARQQSVKLQPKGSCYNCHEHIDAGLFCDDDCRDDWQLRNPNK